MKKIDIANMSRRDAITMGLVLFGTAVSGSIVSVPAFAQGAPAQAQQIANHFSSVKTMAGEFVQFGPRGEQTGGKFFISRPGKIRFDYEAPSSYRVVSDGTSVVIDNRKLNTSDLYPLSKTPLKLLLDERIDLSGGRVTDVKEEPDLTTIQIADRQVFGNSRIKMMFDPNNYELRQWTITDAQGKDTTVMIFNVQQGVNLDPGMFTIDYKRNRVINEQRRRN